MEAKMKKPDAVTYLCFVQDHSGSMSRKKQYAIDNFNEQRAKLLKEDDPTMESLVTIIEFDDHIHCNVDNFPLSDIKEMSEWWTGGMTALYDGIGFGINNVKIKMDADDRKNKAALFIIQTDGQENASSDFKGEEGRMKIRKMIDDFEETKLWSFVFLGENIDETVAMDMGFKMGNIMSHGSKGESISAAYAVTSDSLGDFMKDRKRGMTQTKSFYTIGKSSDDNK
jgi:hypothetical protein